MAKNSGMPLIPTLLLLIAIASLLQGIFCVEYIVYNDALNTTGGRRFETEVGAPYTIKTAGVITPFIWKLFKQNSPAQRKNITIVYINITTLDDSAFAMTSFDPPTATISFDSFYIESYLPQGGEKFEFTSTLYHEMAHVFQWTGQRTARSQRTARRGLLEGVADYVMIKANYYNPQNYTKPGEGNIWDWGYGITARFLEYCDTLKPGFTVDLNNKMRQVYKDEYFLDLLGKPVDQLWKEYKAKYAK